MTLGVQLYCMQTVLVLKKNREIRYVLVFCQTFVEQLPSEKKAQTKTHSLQNILNSSRSQSNSIKTDHVNEFVNKLFTKLSKIYSFKRYSRFTFIWAVSAERFKETIRDLLKKHVFEKGNDNWINVLPTLTKKYNNRCHSLTKINQSEIL